MGAWYCTREMVMRALDAPATIRANAQIDRLIEASSRAADKLCARPTNAFAPTTATRTFDWPPQQSSAPHRLWLDQHSLISLSALTSGGVTIASTDYFLRPDSGPPYTRIEIDLASSAAWSSGDTHQRAVSATGVWCEVDDDRTCGALAEALDASETSVDVTAACAAEVGAGSILLCGSERMTVSARTSADTGVNTGSALTASMADQTITVADGTAFAAGEILLIDAERILVTATTAATLIVERAQDGTTLAAHSSGADIYAYRTLTVVRGALGTTAATHTTSTALTRHQPPGPVEQYTIARTLAGLGGEISGYSGTAGSEQSTRRVTAAQLQALADELHAAYGRRTRHRAV